MALAYSPVAQHGPLSQQYPPPLHPKPGKDNVRLQKLLKRSAKKKSSTQASQSATPFRSSLSPVNEASPDLEHSDNSTPPRTPESSHQLFNIQPVQRFTVRPLYQHVASPYPQRAAFGRPATRSPQPLVSPSFSYSQQVTTVSTSSVTAHASQVYHPTVPRISGPTQSVPDSELKKTATVTFAESPAALKPATAGGGQQPKATSRSPSPYSLVGGQAVIRPITVLAPLTKSKSPRPTFKATEPSRSPKPMFDVPQIRMYTASTSYYETSRTPPVYDTATLTAIGSMVLQNKTETKSDVLLGSEVRRGTTPIPQPISFEKDIQGKAPTSESKTGTATTEDKTPTLEIKRATPTIEGKSAELKRATPTLEVNVTMPKSETRVKTPTYEFEGSRISAGRPRTPAHHVTRAQTPAFEVSKPNPLLFAVTSVKAEPEKSSTSQTVYQNMKTREPAETLLNGDVHSHVTPAAKPILESVVKSTSEGNLTRDMSSPSPASSLTPTVTPMTTGVAGYQRPKTPTYEATRLRSTSPGYQRPKTPTHGTPRSGVSPVAFQRPKTPTQGSQRSGYRGLTPAEYAAYGGIKTYSPAFGITSQSLQTQEVSVEFKTLSQGPSVAAQSMLEVSEVKEPSKDLNKAQKKEEKLPSIPTIVVSQASEISGTAKQEETTTVVSGVVAVKQETTVIQETPKVEPPKASEKQKVETPPQMKQNIPEVTQPQPKGASQDPQKVEKKPQGKSKPEIKEQKSQPEKKLNVSEKIEPEKPAAASQIKFEEPKTKPVVPGTGESKSVPVLTPEEKQSDDTLPTAEPLLKVLPKPKGVKTKASGWSRLKKHMVVEQEEPKFPETGREIEVGGLDQKEVEKKEGNDGDEAAQDKRPTSESPKATKMWDAVLFQMFSSKENIMHQIELNKSEEELKEEKPDEAKEIPSFAHRLPVLLFSPKFDAKKLREAASRPVTKISTVFEMGLIGRKTKEEEPKDFNRTARGFTSS